MDYKTLMAKIAAKKMKEESQKPEVKPSLVVEETPHKIIVEEKKEEPILLEESEKAEDKQENKREEIKPAAPKKKPAAKKPAERVYMVVENIDEVNEPAPAVEEEIDF